MDEEMGPEGGNTHGCRTARTIGVLELIIEDIQEVVRLRSYVGEAAARSAE
jgi:hypothetical protein